jgi:hypothetical protein
LAEMVIIWGVAALVLRSGQHMPLVRKVNDITWFVGGLGSFGFAVAGLVADAQRLTAFVAALVAILAFFICGIQFLV